MEEVKNISRSKLDILLWILITLLIVIGIFANFYFGSVVWSIRFALGIVQAGIVVALLSFTSQGKKIWVFIKEARLELRKVVWPTRDETVKTTAIVAVLVFVMSVVLWAVDSILLWLFGILTR